MARGVRGIYPLSMRDGNYIPSGYVEELPKAITGRTVVIGIELIWIAR